MVAVGNLDKIWLSVPEDVSAENLHDAFQSYFGAKWSKVLSSAEKSFTYHSANNIYFSVRDLRPVKNLTLDQLLKTKGICRPPNIIVS